VTPDIIVTAKGLSGGIYPITATLYSDRLNPFIHENPFIHISTFGGPEPGCRVAMKVIEILEDPEFLHHVNEMAGVFAVGFEELRGRHRDVVVETRQRGLFMGIKMKNEMCGPLMTVAGFDHGVFTVYANNDSSVSQIVPPLIITRPEAEHVLERLDRMLGWTASRIQAVD
jgi:acetylornithine/succinyldiaminopimelate/putrescine aminotransferase